MISRINAYPQLREESLRNPLREVLPPTPDADLTTKQPRKRRCDSIYATAKERQAAYRARLQESRRAGIEQPSPTANTDTPIPPVEQPSVTVCEAPVTEIGPEEAKTQYSACYGSSEESYDISESVPLRVTPEACGEREELRVIEE